MKELIPARCWVVVDQNERGRLCSLRLMASNTMGGRGEPLARNLEPEFAKRLVEIINAVSAPSSGAEEARLRKELQYVRDVLFACAYACPPYSLEILKGACTREVKRIDVALSQYPAPTNEKTEM